MCWLYRSPEKSRCCHMYVLLGSGSFSLGSLGLMLRRCSSDMPSGSCLSQTSFMSFSCWISWAVRGLCMSHATFQSGCVSLSLSCTAQYVQTATHTVHVRPVLMKCWLCSMQSMATHSFTWMAQHRTNMAAGPSESSSRHTCKGAEEAAGQLYTHTQLVLCSLTKPRSARIPLAKSLSLLLGPDAMTFLCFDVDQFLPNSRSCSPCAQQARTRQLSMVYFHLCQHP